ncbi:MAG: S26 family signal peptidase [Planctomycetota bacterium]
MTTSDSNKPVKPKSSLKETITSLTIAFAMAFVFRGFVIEGFVIPTGSMAPTLMGAHHRIHSPQSGYTWAVNNWDRGSTPDVTDPLLGVGTEVLGPDVGARAEQRGGDRIFVLKYLTGLYDAERFDSAVFKFPGNPAENYIKRIAGMPNEEVALVDGDIFTRPLVDVDDSVPSDWTASDWTIVRKPERVQRELWMPVFDSAFAPIDPERDGRTWFRPPWLGEKNDGERDRSWTIGANQIYSYDGAGSTNLVWDFDRRPVTDRYAYNETDAGGTLESRFPGDLQTSQSRVFPVSDVRASFNIELEDPQTEIGFEITTRGRQFKVVIAEKLTGILSRPVPDPDAEPQAPSEPQGVMGLPGWTTLETKTHAMNRLGAGRPIRIEFWHADQAIAVWINGEEVARAEYDWSPAERIEAVTGFTASDLVSAGPRDNRLADTSNYQPAQDIRLTFEGGPFKLHRVRLDRDLHYQAALYSGNAQQRPHSLRNYAARSTHPVAPMRLGPDHFLLCGDNSAASLDSRLWDNPSPWIERALGDGTPGVVHRDLLIGKAFVVYLPALKRDRGFPVPDLGRVRWIW